MSFAYTANDEIFKEAPKMNAEVVVFTSSETGAGERLVRALRRHDTSPEPVVLAEIDSLQTRLRRTPRRIGVVVLIATDRDELRRLVELDPMLSNIPRLLVVSDSEPATVELAHRLRPRFLSFTGESVHTVTAVVERILARRYLTDLS